MIKVIREINPSVQAGQDITGNIYLISKKSICAEVINIYEFLYGGDKSDANVKLIKQSFDEVEAMYLGRKDGYKGANTKYHDLPHTFSVTLAASRLICGHELSNEKDKIGGDLFTLGILVALFHDSGYILKTNDRKHKFGAEYTKIHVSRSAKILTDYIHKTKLKNYCNIAGKIVHFTGMEKELEKISFYNNINRKLGQIVGTADYLAQMSDRSYLEKCRDYLYEEYVVGGLDKKFIDGKEIKKLESADELVRMTSSFFDIVKQKFVKDFGECNKYEGVFFNGLTPYYDGIVKNINYIKKITSQDDISKYLRRSKKNDLE